MGREVRMVPETWEHPKDERGRFKPLHGDSFSERLARWNEENAQWTAGFERHTDYSAGYPNGVVSWVPKAPGRPLAYCDWDGNQPSQDDYMPDWPAAERTHCQMYETCSEGTPISPVMESPEALARWLTDNNVSAFGDQGASYEGWLRVCLGGYAPTAIIDGKGIRSGVDL